MGRTCNGTLLHLVGKLINMKKILTILSLLSITLFSCNKKDETAKFDFRVNEVKDFELDAFQEILPIDVECLSGVAERVTLSISGIPSGLFNAEIENVTGTPDFSTFITFSSIGRSVPGVTDYPIKIIATSTSGLSKTYDMVVKYQY